MLYLKISGTKANYEGNVFMDNNRTMELLKRAVNHIESFEEDQSAEVLASLGFTQSDLAEIEAFAVREDSERKGSQYYPLQKFNSNEECAYALHRYLIKHKKESSSSDVYYDILHDINNLRGHEWLQGLKRNEKTRAFFDYIRFPEYSHENFLCTEAVPSNLFFKAVTNIGRSTDISFDELRDFMDQNGFDHLWDYSVSDLEEAVSNNELVLAVSFYEDGGYFARIFECDDEIADRYFAIEAALSDGMDLETALSLDFSTISDRKKSLDSQIHSASSRSAAAPSSDKATTKETTTDRYQTAQRHSKQLNSELVRMTKNNMPYEMIRLIREGADVNYKDKFGVPVLQWATNHANSHTIELLVEHGADVNAQDKEGKTKLMLMASYGDLDVVSYLLEHGANVSLKDREGRDALSYAKECLSLFADYSETERDRYEKVVALLEKAMLRENKTVSLSDQVQAASTRATKAQTIDKTPVKELPPER